MVDFINATGLIGTILNAGTTSLGGDLTSTLLIVLLFIMAVALMFGIPLEYTAVIIIPLCISIGAFYSTFWIPIFIIILFLSFLIAKNWIFR